MVDEVDVHSISHVLLEFLFLRPVSLRWGSHRVHWASEFQKDTVFILVVELNSIRSLAIEGGDFLIRQNDVLSGVEFGDIRSQPLIPENRLRCTRI